MNIKKILIKELGFLIISALLVVLSYLIAGTFFEIWIRDYPLLLVMTVAFYLIIGFYRFLNRMARRYRNDHGENNPDVKNG